MSTTGWVPFLGLQVKSLVPGTFVPGFFIANLIAEVQLGILGPLNIRGDSVGAVRRVTPPGCSGVMSVGGLAKAVVVVPMAIIIVARRVVSNQFFFMDLLRCICGCWLSCRQGARCWPHDDVWGPRYEGPTVGMGRYQVISR